MQTSAGHCRPSVFTVCRSCADGGGINVGQVGREGGEKVLYMDAWIRDDRIVGCRKKHAMVCGPHCFQCEPQNRARLGALKQQA